MRTRDYLEGLTQLHRLEDPEERRGLWRQSLATLGATIVNLQHPAPLEGLDPDELLRSVERARADRMLDDLEWLPGPFAAASLYEFAAALPPERRQARDRSPGVPTPAHRATRPRSWRSPRAWRWAGRAC
jgi:hypothetical protein